jgi:hypothetical protein
MIQSFFDTIITLLGFSLGRDLADASLEGIRFQSLHELKIDVVFLRFSVEAPALNTIRLIQRSSTDQHFCVPVQGCVSDRRMAACDTWAATPSMVNTRFFHTATRLLDGRVLVAGTSTSTTNLNSAELYDPVGNAWHATASMNLF